jgi:hypothetical protein
MMTLGEGLVKKKKFDVVKHVKRLSRLAKAPKAQVVPAKKKELLRAIAEKEARESHEP